MDETPVEPGAQQPAEELSTRELVLGMADAEGAIDAGAVYELAEAIGLSHQQVRLCFRRLVGEGLFVQQGRGQRARFTATETGQAQLAPDHAWLQFAYRQDAGLERWDGRWHLVGFAVPEVRRAARDEMRGALLRLGGAPLEGGWYLSPHPWEPEVGAIGARLGLTASLTLAEVSQLQFGGVDVPAGLAARLWPLDSIGARYHAFLAAFTPLEGQLKRGELSESQLVSAALAMAAGFDASVRHDPLLPPELLPADWPGTAARELLASMRRKSLEQSALLRQSALFRSYDGLFASRVKAPT